MPIKLASQQITDLLRQHSLKKANYELTISVSKQPVVKKIYKNVSIQQILNMKISDFVSGEPTLEIDIKQVFL